MKRETQTKIIPMFRAERLLGIGDIVRRACVEKGTLPMPINAGSRSSGYYSHELEALIAACNSGAGADEMRELVKKIHQEREPLAQNFKRFAV